MNASQKRPLAAFWILAVLVALVMTAGLHEGAARTVVRAETPAVLAGALPPGLLLGAELDARPQLPALPGASAATAPAKLPTAPVVRPSSGAAHASTPAHAGDSTPPAATAPASPQGGTQEAAPSTSPRPTAAGHAQGKGKHSSAGLRTVSHGKVRAGHGGHGRG